MAIDGADGRGSARGLTAVLALVVLGFAAYAPGLDAPFLLDDFTSLPENPSIRDLAALGEVLSPPANTTVEGRPVLNASFALNRALLGEGVRGFRLVNVAIHVLAALLLLGVARRTFARLRPERAALAPALAVAALWMLHPLQVGAVTYLVQRAESLMGLFFLASLYAAIRAFDAQRSVGWAVAAAAAGALAVGTKEVAVALPLVVWAYDRVFVSGSFGRALRRRPGLYAGLFATWILLGFLVAGAPRSGSVGFGYEHLPPWRYALTQFGVVLHYLRVALLPVGLVFDHDWPVVETPGAAWLPALCVLALVVGTFAMLARGRPAGFLGAAFFLVLAPTSTIVPIATEIAADHRAYLPLAAVIALVVAAVDGVARSPRARRVAGALAAGAAAVLLVLTVRRNLLFRSAYDVWAHVAACEPHNARARSQLGLILLRQGDAEGARAYSEQALALGRPRPDTLLNLGCALLELGDAQGAVERLEASLALAPGNSLAWTNLGVAWSRLGDDPRAAEAFRSALALDPDDALARVNLAGTLVFLGDLDAARDEWLEALARAPGDERVHRSIEAAREELLRVGRPDVVEALRTARVRAYEGVGLAAEARALVAPGR